MSDWDRDVTIKRKFVNMHYARRWAATPDAEKVAYCESLIDEAGYTPTESVVRWMENYFDELLHG